MKCSRRSTGVVGALRVVVVEAVDQDGVQAHHNWEPPLIEAGYSLGLFDGINRFYCRNEDADALIPRLAAPANVLDNWRSSSEVTAQCELAAALDRERIALEEERRALEEECRAHAVTREALTVEQTARAEVQQQLETVFRSTSWRVTLPLRDLSRTAKLMRRGSAS